jgi:hypothetical protein
MRTFFGIILGIFLTVGGAYLYDTSATGNPGDQATVEQKPMVNWDVVSGNRHRWTLALNNTWKKLESTKI